MQPAEDGILVRFFYPAALKTKGALRGPSVPWYVHMRAQASMLTSPIGCRRGGMA